MPEKCGTSQAFCTAMLQIADSLRLFALFGRSSPENWGTSQAICIVLGNCPTVSGCLHFLGAPFPKIAERLRLFAVVEKTHDEIVRQSQALRTPFPKIAERLRLSAPPC